MHNLLKKNHQIILRSYSIQMETKVTITDNSGVKIGKCIFVKPFSKKSGAKIASEVKISARKLRKSKKIIKGEICRGVFVRSKKVYQRDTGFSLKCDDNAIILLDNKNVPIGTRVYGVIYKELKNRDLYPKAVLMARLKI